MEPLQTTLDRLNAMGCRARLKGDTFTVARIPTWAARCEVESILPELSLLALAVDILQCEHVLTPLADSEDEIPGNKCRFCLHYHMYQCEKHGDISPTTLKNGCSDFSFNDGVYL
jgi:hypothetical protein